MKRASGNNCVRRLSGIDSSFVFLKPPLFFLVFSSVMLVLFFLAGLIRMDGWFAEDFSILKNLTNGAVIATLFAATTQLFNSLIPEQGLPYWIVGFCFFWTLWNNLFADFDTKKLLRSLGGLFGLAFVVKYLVLFNLAAPAGRTWFERLTENPGQEAFAWLLDLPRFAPGTGYIQFFTLALYLLGLFLLPASTRASDNTYEVYAAAIADRALRVTIAAQSPAKILKRAEKAMGGARALQAPRRGKRWNDQTRKRRCRWENRIQATRPNLYNLSFDVAARGRDGLQR